MAKTCLSCTSGDRKMKVDSKEKFEVKYLILKLATCGDIINLKMGQKGIFNFKIGYLWRHH